MSKGEDPLPAEVRMKCCEENPDDFFYIDPKDWCYNKLPRKVYANPVQEGLRRIMGRALVRTFALFEYKKHPLVELYCPTFNAPHESMISEVIDIVEYEFTIHQDTMSDVVKNLQSQEKTNEATWCQENITTLANNFSRMGSAFLARQILDTTHSFRVNKNWNSHGAQVGASICQLGSILAAFENASKNRLLSTHFAEVIPRGCVQTGAKHDNHDVTYVEYMCSAVEPQMVIGGSEPYLNHIRFRKDNHAQKVRKLFDQKMENLNAPVPRPTRAHTYDFNCTYMGVRLIDGECKGDSKPKAKSAASSVLVLHSVEQLAYKNTALSMLTTNDSITFFEAVKDVPTNRICVTFDEGEKYDLEPVVDMNQDLDSTLPYLADPPKYCFPSQAGGFIGEYEENKTHIVDTWREMRSEPKKMVLAILHAVDVIAEYLSTVDLKEAAAKRERSYGRGFKEPFFLSTSEHDLKSQRPIRSPENFIYCTRTMEGVMTQDQLHDFHKMMFNHYREVLINGGDEVNEEVRKMCTEGMAKHANASTKW